MGCQVSRDMAAPDLRQSGQLFEGAGDFSVELFLQKLERKILIRSIAVPAQLVQMMAVGGVVHERHFIGL